MKIENTFENKSKFLAQHWGQQGKFTRGNYVHKKNDTFVINEKTINLVSRSSNKVDGALIVYKLETISDADLTEVLRIQGYDISNDVNRDKGLHLISPETIIHLSFEAYQFLYSKSFELPYKDLSIDYLHHYGWITYHN